MALFNLICPDCKIRLRRVTIMGVDRPIEQITWLYACRKCGKRWEFFPLFKKLIEFQGEATK
jgi:hypothetical protein